MKNLIRPKKRKAFLYAISAIVFLLLTILSLYWLQSSEQNSQRQDEAGLEKPAQER